MTTVITDEKLAAINAQRRAAGRPILGKADAVYLMERRRNAVRAQTGRDERSDHLLHYLIAYSWVDAGKKDEAPSVESSASSADGFSPFPASEPSSSYSSSSSGSDSGGSSGGDSGGGGE
jgi:uncharacterized membrane protein YgcG